MNLRLPSLRNRLLHQVLWPLSLTWLFGAILTAAIGHHFIQQAYDRSLLDDALLVASHVRREVSTHQDSLQLELSAQEMRAILFDASESLYFSVWQPDGRLVAGHQGLRPEKLPEALDQPVFETLQWGALELRIVALRRAQPGEHWVVMGQTTRSRNQTLQRLLAYSMAPQLLLLLLLANALMRRIDHDLQPLANLGSALESRRADDFSRIPLAPSTRELQDLAQTLNGLLQRIAESVAAQREFSGNVAHELRNPLAGIRAQAEYGLQQSDPQVWREQLAGILESQGRASHLIDQLLALALADEARQLPELVPLPLDELVREAVLRHLGRADALGVDLGAQGAERSVTVLGQRALIEGVLNNLIDNALRYGLAAQEPRRVTVAIDTRGESCVLSVIDNGPGVSDVQWQRLTQRWVRGEQRHLAREGSGLGLAIVSAYARLLRAHLAFHNETPHGWRVSLRFDPPTPPVA